MPACSLRLAPMQKGGMCGTRDSGNRKTQQGESVNQLKYHWGQAISGAFPWHLATNSALPPGKGEARLPGMGCPHREAYSP